MASLDKRTHALVNISSSSFVNLETRALRFAARVVDLGPGVDGGVGPGVDIGVLATEFVIEGVDGLGRFISAWSMMRSAPTLDEDGRSDFGIFVPLPSMTSSMLRY